MSDQLYRQQIIENYKNPQNSGMLDDYTHKAKMVNSSCGDEIEVFLKVNDTNQIEKISFDGRGCAISIASASLTTEELKNQNVEKVLTLDEEFIQELLGTNLTGSRIKCGMLGLEALQKALRDEGKN